MSNRTPVYKDVFVVNHEEILGFFEDYRFLSNFHLCPIYHDGIHFQSTENAFQAAKFTEFETRRQFGDLTPTEAKKLVRRMQLTSHDATLWDDRKDTVLLELLLLKFMDRDLRKKLVDTRDKYLEKTNYWGDKYWGVCDGVGENRLQPL